MDSYGDGDWLRIRPRAKPPHEQDDGRLVLTRSGWPIGLVMAVCALAFLLAAGGIILFLALAKSGDEEVQKEAQAPPPDDPPPVQKKPLPPKRVKGQARIPPMYENANHHRPEPVSRPVEEAPFKSLREGKFVKPAPSPVPTTYLRVISTPGDWVGRGQTYSYEEDELLITGGHGIRVKIHADGWSGWRLYFSAQRGGFLVVGEYPNAKEFLVDDDFPGISFTGFGRSPGNIKGHFVVWEFEVEREEVLHLAIDFNQHRDGPRGPDPPLYGMVRYKSRFK